MQFLKTASFGGLFKTTFVVGANFQIAFALIGLVVAFASPSFFQLNGAPAGNAGQAIIALIILLIALLMLNAICSAVGAAIWVGVRRFLPSHRATDDKVFE